MCKSPPPSSHKESGSRAQAGLSQLHPADVTGVSSEAMEKVVGETRLLT
jgi:hypothetical protein